MLYVVPAAGSSWSFFQSNSSQTIVTEATRDQLPPYAVRHQRSHYYLSLLCTQLYIKLKNKYTVYNFLLWIF